MKRIWLPLLFCVLEAGLALALGLYGEVLSNRVELAAVPFVLLAALLMFILLAVVIRLLLPERAPGEEALITLPLHWGVFFPLAVLLGTLVGLGGVRFLGSGYVGGTIHTYEVVGLGLGVVLVLALAFGGAPYPAAAFSLGYGLALPSAILFLDPLNVPAITYSGHVGVMGALAALVVIFGTVVRIKLVD